MKAEQSPSYKNDRKIKELEEKIKRYEVLFKIKEMKTKTLRDKIKAYEIRIRSLEEFIDNYIEE